ncbi:MAG: hypothetical protein WC471_03245 [Candidatus Woesearchaeota archaeon]
MEELKVEHWLPLTILRWRSSHREWYSHGKSSINNIQETMEKMFNYRYLTTPADRDAILKKAIKMEYAQIRHVGFNVPFVLLELVFKDHRVLEFGLRFYENDDVDHLLELTDRNALKELVGIVIEVYFQYGKPICISVDPALIFPKED